MKTIEVTITQTNAHCENSHYETRLRIIINNCEEIRRAAFQQIPACHAIACMDPYDMAAEWLAHNILYELHILRSHTASVDINTDKPRWAALLYHAIGRVIKLFYK